jgi:hypothetical protein
MAVNHQEKAFDPNTKALILDFRRQNLEIREIIKLCAEV